MTKGKLAQLLALAPEQVARHPHTIRRRYGGGEYHIFTAGTVLRAFHDHGGIEQLADRIWRKRERARVVDAEAVKQAALQRAAQLDWGLSAIGIASRSDSYWQRRSLALASFWTQQLAATHRYFLQ